MGTQGEPYIEDIAASEIPEYMKQALVDWVLKGNLPGDFMVAVLENNLTGAVGRADQNNLRALRQWVICLHNYVPGDCHGSPEIVAAWHAHQGLRGWEDAQRLASGG